MDVKKFLAERYRALSVLVHILSMTEEVPFSKSVIDK